MSGGVVARHGLAWVAVLLAIGGTAGGLGYYKYMEISAAIAAAEAFPEPREAVEAVQVRRGEWTASTRAVGTVVALRQVEIRNELPGTVVEMGFASGEIVEAGQVLVRLDTQEERAALAAAQAEARLAQTVFDRRSRLTPGDVVSVLDLDRARAELAAAKARVAGLEAGIAKKTLAAPFRARVGLTDLQPGAYLDEGTSVAMLQGVDSDAYVDFTLPQDMAAAIRPGVAVSLAGPQIPDGSVSAEIVAEDASIDADNRAVRFRAIARGLGERLRPGAFVDVVAVTAAPQPALLVPLTAVRRAPYGDHVFVLEEEAGQTRARQRIVRTGPVQGTDIVITDGLAAGELIAGAGSFKLRDGLLVVSSDPPGERASITSPADRSDPPPVD
jgi:membrane fusion protein, multidrug efflux system